MERLLRLVPALALLSPVVVAPALAGEAPKPRVVLVEADGRDEEVSAFVAEKMRARLKDPALIDLLVPKAEDYGFGTHRVPLETNYLEVYHRDNVRAVGVKDNPIAEITPEGVRLADGALERHRRKLRRRRFVHRAAVDP